MPKSPKSSTKSVESFTHEDDKRKNIPTVEHRAIMHDALKTPIQVEYARRNPDLDPQLIWRGKEMLEEDKLSVPAPPLYIQEKVHPQALIEDLLRQTKTSRASEENLLFGDFNGLPKGVDKTEFYKHDQNWTNRMVLGDSLQVMASLAEREGLRGKVQCIYLDPPYGIKFNSNFQWSTTSRDVKDGNAGHITREPEQVKAFRDTWRDGIHSYLSYLRDRLIVARDLLTDSGSIFIQISNENVHKVRVILDEVFGDDNCIATIVFKKASPETKTIKNSFNYILWYSKNKEYPAKVYKLFRQRRLSDGTTEDPKKLALWLITPNGEERTLSTDEKREQTDIPDGSLVFRADKVRDSGKADDRVFRFKFNGESLDPGSDHCWRGDIYEMNRLYRASRLLRTDETLAYKYFLQDNWGVERTNVWEDTAGKIPDMRYIVETNEKIVERCILLTTQPGDLVLDPTCGSGTTATVAEQWGRRWITIDTSRVALALARARIMGARYPYYLLADTEEGKRKEAELSRKTISSQSVHGNIKQGFVYERVPHITLKSIANNAEIDVIWEKYLPKVEGHRKDLNAALRGHKSSYKVSTGGREGKEIRFDAKEGEKVKLPSGEEALLYELLDWEIPREAPKDWPSATKVPLEAYWQARIERQKEIDASIAAKAEYEYLYDKPYENKSVVRVAGPFTVESLSPHRLAEVEPQTRTATREDFSQVILDTLRTSGVQFAHKDDKISFTSLVPWPGELLCAEAKYLDASGNEVRAGIFLGPEYGTVTRPDLVEAAREASESGFGVVIACAFNFEAQTTEFDKLGKVPILKARMNADLHMAKDLKNTGKGNLFVVFGEPDIEIQKTKSGEYQVQIKGVDVFDPNSGEVRSDGPDGIACWFLDTDYNEESFFVRHAYFLGAGDPYKSLKTTLKSEIDEAAWSTLNSDTSRPFPKPESGRIAVKVINHLGDEVMKVYKIG
ncbi:site-specific DNA-methyltransferase [Leptospira levettii]|uniref:site-specific DNA-methyltransferase n=1 Tax=Leptospira levettii TaxID=2023178 RepID=UPI003EB815C2